MYASLPTTLRRFDASEDLDEQKDMSSVYSELMSLPNTIRSLSKGDRSEVASTSPRATTDSALELHSPVRKKRRRLSLSVKTSSSTSASNTCGMTPSHTASPSSELSSSASPAKRSTPHRAEIPVNCSPDVYVQRLLRCNGYDSTSRPASSLTGFFETPTRAQIEAYDATVVTAVRDEDIDTLRNIYDSGRTLQCCNRFGESLTHMACRRGFVDVAKFLLEVANVSTRVKDDYGRTILHDACWSSQPRFELVDLLIKRDPDLLLISDARGFVPFQYVKREHWGQWIDFLSERKHLIRPRQFNFTTATCA
mmetsp:Transcript_25114/g.54805  ORF Transcript_25114/g.54805 Transcript_25114/m.54805 type:complete len:309 (-) Transcript_25114:60-986(-)